MTAYGDYELPLTPSHHLLESMRHPKASQGVDPKGQFPVIKPEFIEVYFVIFFQVNSGLLIKIFIARPKTVIFTNLCVRLKL